MIKKKTVDHISKAEELATKAVGVFTNAVEDVEKAIDILKNGIEEDSTKILAIENKIQKLIAEIEQIKEGKNEKGQKIVEHTDLLKTLKGIINK